MNKSLKNKKIAILVANGFEQVELTEPRQALEAVGALTEIVSPEKQEVSNSVILALSCWQAATRSVRSWYTSQSAPIRRATSASLRPAATSSLAAGMSIP